MLADVTGVVVVLKVIEIDRGLLLLFFTTPVARATPPDEYMECALVLVLGGAYPSVVLRLVGAALAVVFTLVSVSNVKSSVPAAAL
jgi:hypothetical protein